MSAKPYFFVRFLAALLLACVLNAGVTAAIVYNFKSQLDTTNSAQQKQGQLIEYRLCTTLHRLSTDTPPAGNPKTNPSRAYDQTLHSTLSELGPDIDCPK